MIKTMFEIEINFSSQDFERALKWYGLAFKDRHPSIEDEKIYNKLGVLVDSLRQDEIMERLQENDED
jgi:hypothetical protein